MKFKVLSRERVEKYNVQEKHILISFRDVGSAVPNFPVNSSRVDTLLFEFSDVACRHLDKPEIDDDFIERNNIILFNKEFAKEIWEAVKKYNDDIEWIVVHCEAGISRSAGCVAALSKILNGDDSYFFKHFLPNTLVYKLILREAQNE